MNTDHSSERLTYAFQPTIIEDRLLIQRLAIQIAFLNKELRRSWVHFRNDPAAFGRRLASELSRNIKTFVSTPHTLRASLTAVGTIATLVVAVFLIDRKGQLENKDPGESPVELTLLNISTQPDTQENFRVGKDGPGRVGFKNDRGEGSGSSPRQSHGGGGSGDHNPAPPQVGKVPPPSEIRAAIPTTPPITPPALPVAGIDIDPALWKDLKAPVYGDPRSKSEMPSKGPGDSGGIGTNKGLGTGEGVGPGFGPGRDGNMGDDSKQTGCCGPGGGDDSQGQPGRTFSPAEVEQRAKLLLKPEPHYTEEARKNQVSGTVVLRVVFSSAGEVVGIRAQRTLPFGLTEQAIAAARQIKFVPAMKSGHAVSVHMQLEYNFNLY
jgi:TonB family protein